MTGADAGQNAQILHPCRSTSAAMAAVGTYSGTKSGGSFAPVKLQLIQRAVRLPVTGMMDASTKRASFALCAGLMLELKQQEVVSYYALRC